LEIYSDSELHNNYIDQSKVSENDYTVITNDNIQPKTRDILFANDGISLQASSEVIDVGLNPESDEYRTIINSIEDYRTILDLLKTDKIGNQRIHNNTIDMGAFELGSSK